MEFVECSICAAKLGSPTLCDSCLVNRATIAKLKTEVTKLMVTNSYNQGVRDACEHFGDIEGTDYGAEEALLKP